MKKINSNDFIERCRKIHPALDYSRAIYRTKDQKIEIGCPLHGFFHVQAGNHLYRKVGCKLCAFQIRAEKNKRPEQVIETRNRVLSQKQDQREGKRLEKQKRFCDKIKKLYPEYDLSRVHYVTNKIPVEIGCPKHGWIKFVPNGIDVGRGCTNCGRESGWERRRSSSFRENTSRGKLQSSYLGLTSSLPSGLTPLFTQDEWKGTHNQQTWHRYHWKCVCGHTFQRTIQELEKLHCERCTPTSFESHGEQEVGEFLKSLGLVVEKHNRLLIAPFELDLVVPEKKIAIEYCGLYWHSEGANFRTRDYHVNKLEKCLAKGYRLITLFEDEWKLKRSVVENRIRTIMGMSERGPGARHIQIRRIPVAEARVFLDRYHVQGAGSPGPWCYGGFEGDRLCGVMTFGQPRRALGRTSGPVELIRYVTDQRVYPGLASKLFKNFVREMKPEGVLSYADRRWSDGNLYKRLGFELTGMSRPSYAYTRDYQTREYRYRYRKSRLEEKFGNVGDRTEWDIMQEKGFDRIWDCGTLRFVWSI